MCQGWGVPWGQHVQCALWSNLSWCLCLGVWGRVIWGLEQPLTTAAATYNIVLCIRSAYLTEATMTSCDHQQHAKLHLNVNIEQVSKMTIRLHISLQSHYEREKQSLGLDLAKAILNNITEPCTAGTSAAAAFDPSIARSLPLQSGAPNARPCWSPRWGSRWNQLVGICEDWMCWL